MPLPDPDVTPTLLVPEAAALLDVGRTTAYAAIREGTWPTQVIRVGSTIRIPTAAILRLLEVDEENSDHAEWRVTMGGRLIRDPEPVPEEIP
jgi:excisionase family DNA binding protein